MGGSDADAAGAGEVAGGTAGGAGVGSGSGRRVTAGVLALVADAGRAGSGDGAHAVSATSIAPSASARLGMTTAIMTHRP